MDLQAKIEECKAKTKEIREANPLISQVNWEIEDIPYRDFLSFYENKGAKMDRDVKPLTDGRLFYVAQLGPNGCQVIIFSVPVKIKMRTEVEELT